ncbi:MAG: hypothetical protein LBU24_04360 [Methanocalculaceae archaeon]|nr:hypothetical protein [Methanocalculaceae archaeon]
MVSSAAGIVLLLTLGMVMCVIVVAMLSGAFAFSAEGYESIPEIIAIGELHHEISARMITYAGSLYLIHVGTKPIELSGHSAEVYVNGVKQRIVIQTLKGSEFISSLYHGVSRLQFQA